MLYFYGNEFANFIVFPLIVVLINLTEISLYNSSISHSLLRVLNDREKDCIVCPSFHRSFKVV